MISDICYFLLYPVYIFVLIILYIAHFLGDLLFPLVFLMIIGLYISYGFHLGLHFPKSKDKLKK